MCSEQSAGFILLALLCVPLQPLLAETVQEAVRGEPDCWTVRKGGLTDEVDDRGVPGFDYKQWRICDGIE